MATALDLCKLAAVRSGIQTSLDDIDSGLLAYSMACLNMVCRNVWNSHPWRNSRRMSVEVYAEAADLTLPEAVGSIRSLSSGRTPVRCIDEIAEARLGVVPASGSPGYAKLPDSVCGCRRIRLFNVDLPATLSVNAKARFCRLTLASAFPVPAAESAVVEYLAADLLEYQGRTAEADAKRQQASALLDLAIENEDDAEDTDRAVCVPDHGMMGE